MPTENRPSRVKVDFGAAYSESILHLEYERWFVSDEETAHIGFAQYPHETLAHAEEGTPEHAAAAEDMAQALAGHIDAMPAWMQAIFDRAAAIRSAE